MTVGVRLSRIKAVGVVQIIQGTDGTLMLLNRWDIHQRVVTTQ